MDFNMNEKEERKSDSKGGIMLPKSICDLCGNCYFGYYLERKDVVHYCECGNVLRQLLKRPIKLLKDGCTDCKSCENLEPIVGGDYVVYYCHSFKVFIEEKL